MERVGEDRAVLFMYHVCVTSFVEYFEHRDERVARLVAAVWTPTCFDEGTVNMERERASLVEVLL